MIDIKYRLMREDAYPPEKAHEDDSGFDLRTPFSFSIFSHSSHTIDTGVTMLIPKGYTGFLKSKSGLNIKCGITGEGVIDAGYTVTINVRVYNDSPFDQVFNKGDKIIQIVILPIPKVRLMEMTDDEVMPDTERGSNGFGSTGR